MVKWLKKALLAIAIAFCLYFLFTRPESAASAIKTFVSAFDSLITFFETLAS